MIVCPQDWSAGVDLHLIKSDNQLSVKDIVLLCATENLIEVQINLGRGIQNVFIIYLWQAVEPCSLSCSFVEVCLASDSTSE